MAKHGTYPLIILCGSDPERRELLKVHDPLENCSSKAVLPMAGKRVLDWQLDTFAKSDQIDQIYLVGLTEAEFPSEHSLIFVPIDTNSTILEKIKTGSRIIQENHPQHEHVVISTGDTPGMTGESVDMFFSKFREHQDADVVLGVVPEDITLDVFPEHHRIVGRFRDHSVYPGEMFALRHTAIPVLEDEINQISVRRRRFNRRQDTSRLIPILRFLAKRPPLWWMIFKYLIGRLSIPDLERTLTRVFRLKMKSLIIPDPGFGMDLDLPEDYLMLTEYIESTKHLR
jgi:hypothetical protein